MLKQGDLRGERCKYPDGTIGLCVWYPLSSDTEDAGLCFDFADSDTGDMVVLVNRLMNEPPKVIEPDPPTPKFTSIRWRIKPLGWLFGRIHDLGWWLAGI